MTQDNRDIENISQDMCQNINISAYRLLYIYRLLSQAEQISFEDLNTHLLNHPLIQRTFTNETMNKYLNTLRFFGCTIQRFDEHGHFIYHMDDHPLKPKLDPDVVASLNTLLELLSLQPLAFTCKNFYFLIKRLSRIPSAANLTLLAQFESAMNSGISKQTYSQVEHFQKYCLEGQVLEICYESLEAQSTLVLIEPTEVIYHKKRLYLVGNCPKNSKKVRYEIEKIRSHRQLPSRIRSNPQKITVTFKLTGRVALNYRPYPGESVWNKGEFLLVKHKTDDLDQLLRRLMKYGTQCQIISPSTARKEMLDIIEHLINATEEPVEDLILHLASKAQTDETLRKWACYLDNPQTSGAEGAD